MAQQKSAAWKESSVPMVHGLICYCRLQLLTMLRLKPHVFGQVCASAESARRYFCHSFFDDVPKFFPVS